MPRLPRLWSDPDAAFDNNNWGQLLNEFLRVEHAANGTHGPLTGALDAGGNDLTNIRSVVAGGSLKLAVTNPTLSTSDFSFATSVKAVAIDVVASSADLTAGLKGLQGQIQVNAGAPTATSYQGVAGAVQVNIATEVYGMIAWVDWQNMLASGAAVIAITRGVASDPGAGGSLSGVNVARGIIVAAEGTARSNTGLDMYASNAPTNSWRIGISVRDTTDTGIRVGQSVSTNNAGTGIAVRPEVNATDALFLQRFTDTSPTGYYLRAVNAANAVNLFGVDMNITAAETNLLLSVAGATMSRVSVGAADSGGAGFRLLRVPN